VSIVSNGNVKKEVTATLRVAVTRQKEVAYTHFRMATGMASFVPHPTTWIGVRPNAWAGRCSVRHR
jgi:hypothetical protein